MEKHEKQMFSGLLYCAECGGKMYQCRTTNIVTEPYAKYNQKSGYHTDDDRTCCINDITRCSDCYQTCK